MDVSIIIINFNTFDLTSDCVRSVYEKTQGLKYEIILVDNGSSECDSTLFKQAFMEIILVESKVNLGFAKGNNLGIKYAKGDAVLLLNSDTKLLNNAVLLAQNRMQKSGEIGALAGKLFYQDGRVQHNVQRFPSVKLLLFEILRLFYLIPNSKREKVLLGRYLSYVEEIYTDYTWGTFLLIRRMVIEKFPNGKLHEDFFMYEEDKQWCFFIHKLGYKILFSPDPQILHYGSGSSKQNESRLKIQVKIINNEYHFVAGINGNSYAILYFLLKALQYVTSIIPCLNQ